MTPRQRRERLFKSGRPLIRNAVIEDIGWVWAAHRRIKGNGNEPDDQLEFAQNVEQRLAAWDIVYMLEDSNAEFEKGSGPVGVIHAMYNGWTIEPHAVWFPWARKANKLKCLTGFFMKMRNSGKIGSCVLHIDKEHEKFFRHMKRYAPIYPVGKIPAGKPDGADYVFYIRGRKSLEQANA